MTSLDTLKWVATGSLILGFGLVAAGLYEFIFLQLAGGLLWLAASLKMQDLQLIVTNSFLTVAGILGILYHYFG